MIITQTPLRISFAGGGTDFAGYYQNDGGAVISTAIDKYIYVVIKERFDNKIRVGYTRTEMVSDIDEIEHELVRECLRMTGIKHGVEIATMADIPSEGSGLGSSSTVTVGLLLAMYAYQGELVTAASLAEQACKIEIEVLGKPIGKQDQYIAALGNLRRIEFHKDETVSSRVIPLSEDQRRRFGESMMLFYTGITRKADEILSEQKANIVDRDAVLGLLKAQVDEIEICLLENNTNKVGRLLHTGWDLKKQMAGKISNRSIDELYEMALDAGATGGKIAGAGGGGFLLLHTPPDRQQTVRQALSGLKELPFSLERDGAKVILNARR
ncbi:GHMP kinase [Capsulimonas corticalis]|uniref:GHMP kinase n=1 Tax=Capsulimonas corticalis TaxID=2219043 RepID=A0A402CQR8_9BACT|nr:GHMP kinase [Capsulimonas corticalis]BDI32656.1 GHMP kinase [Capsulimonas corticalis]